MQNLHIVKRTHDPFGARTHDPIPSIMKGKIIDILKISKKNIDIICLSKPKLEPIEMPVL